MLKARVSLYCDMLFDEVCVSCLSLFSIMFELKLVVDFVLRLLDVFWSLNQNNY